MVKTKSEPAARIRQLMENLQAGNNNGGKERKPHQKLRVERATAVADNNEQTAPNTASERGGGVDHWERGYHSKQDAARADSSQGSERTRPKLDREEDNGGGAALPKVS